MSYTVRELPPEEWDKARALEGAPWREHGLPEREHTRLIVVEDGGRIVATWAAMDFVHLEGVWIDPAYRCRSGVARRLVQGMFRLLRESRIPTVFSFAQHDHVGRLLRHLGFAQFPAVPYVWSALKELTPCQSSRLFR